MHGLQARNSAGSTTPFRWVLISPLCALLHVLPASSNWPYTPSLSTEKNTQACIQTHTHAQLHSAADLFVTVPLNDHRLIEVPLTCSPTDWERQPSPVMYHTYIKPGQQSKNTLRKSHTNPALIKTTQNGQLRPGLFKCKAGTDRKVGLLRRGTESWTRTGCWNAISSSCIKTTVHKLN